MLQALAEQADDKKDRLGELERFFLFNKLRFVSAAIGDTRVHAQPLRPEAKLEFFLKICEEQRAEQLARMRSRRVVVSDDAIFDDADM